MKVRIYNTFHNTQIVTGVEPEFENDAKRGEYWQELNYYAYGSFGKTNKYRKKVQRIHRVLCGNPECKCGGMIREEVIE